MIACVVKRNPYLPTGTWVEHFDGGWQRAVVETINGRLCVMSHVGIIYPDVVLDEFVMRPKGKGLDK